MILETKRERRRHRELAEKRPPLGMSKFVDALVETGVEARVAQFVWDEFKPYYFARLTPYPTDRPISEIRIDGDDLSDMMLKFEKDFSRHWRGKWEGPQDPTLIEFASGLMTSTSKN